MPPRDPGKVQLDNPLLVADLIQQLVLRGTVGVLDFDATIRPVFIVGDRDLSVDADPPIFASAQIFHLSVFSPVANVALLDTGALSAGVHDIFAQIAWAGTAAALVSGFQLLHRNAADTATLAVLSESVPSNSSTHGTLVMPIRGYSIALGETLRWVNGASNFTGQVGVTIGAALRPSP